MKNSVSIARTPHKADAASARTTPGSQTLLRGLDVLDAVADGPIALTGLAAALGLTRSTTHRLANALVDRRFLSFTPRAGYRFGPKLLELGFLAQRQADVVQLARPHMEGLAALTGDTVHLGIMDGDQALYVGKSPGRRRVDISSRVGDRHPLTSTGLGKALLLDDSQARWKTLHAGDRRGHAPAAEWAAWLDGMGRYVDAGCAFDLEENEDHIRCVAAPIRDASGRIVAALSVSGAAHYMDDARMAALGDDVRDTATAISRDLGWVDGTRPPPDDARRDT